MTDLYVSEGLREPQISNQHSTPDSYTALPSNHYRQYCYFRKYSSGRYSFVDALLKLWLAKKGSANGLGIVITAADLTVIACVVYEQMGSSQFIRLYCFTKQGTSILKGCTLALAVRHCHWAAHQSYNHYRARINESLVPPVEFPVSPVA